MVRIPPIPRLVVQAHDPARAWRRRAIVALAVVLAVVAAWFGGAHLAAPLMARMQTQHASLREDFARQSQVLEETRDALASAERNAQVAQSANQALQETLREREQEIAALRADLGFYERLVGGTQRRTLGVHEIALRALEDPRAFAFELTLTQNLKKSATTEGTVEIAIEGVRDGKVVTVPWGELSGRGDGAPLAFAFKYFQRLQGTLALPAGLTPNRILVSAASRGGERAQQDFAWAEALAPKENDDAGL
jgi:hypothetical protein